MKQADGKIGGRNRGKGKDAMKKNKKETTYRKLEHLTAADIIWNVERLRAESRAKAEHADRLEAYGRQRGLLKKANGDGDGIGALCASSTKHRSRTQGG